MITSQRIRFAQELHDGIAQDLVGLGYAIDSIMASELNESNRAPLRALRFDVTTLIDKVRKEIFELRESDEVNDQLNSGNEVRNNLDRIFNEVLTNAIKHSQGSSVEISIADNGIGGFTEKNDHYGVAGLTERANEIGAQLRIESDFSGTKVMISIPVAQQ